ncbi:MAG: EFR1 family ferrodoxin [Desulfatirhabdiaceae bacterium]
MTSTVFIVYISPAGSTRHVAKQIEDTLESLSMTPQVLDLDAERDPSFFLESIRNAKKDDCIFIGSPVYRDMAVPPIMSFIQSLPVVTGCYAVPFVTWGGASSGIALWQMGQMLVEKGFLLAGAAKIVGVHSLMWRSSEPAGYGHPNIEDDRLIHQFVKDVVNRITHHAIRPIDSDDLDYQPIPYNDEMKRKLNEPWMIIPKTIDQTTCTQCGLCMTVCPVAAVTLKPFPKFSQICFDCFNCIRLCPENAIASVVPFEMIEEHIRSRVSLFNEDRKPGFFVADILE